jgi:hypothetical protein
MKQVMCGKTKGPRNGGDGKDGWSPRERHFYGRLLDEISEGVFILDLNGRLAFVNQVISESAEHSFEWFEDKSYLDLLSNEHKQIAKKLFKVMIDGCVVGPRS